VYFANSSSQEWLLAKGYPLFCQSEFVWLRGVADDEQMYQGEADGGQQQRIAVAVKKIGSGWVLYMGDKLTNSGLSPNNMRL